MEEAGALVETPSLVPISHLPSGFCMWIGDRCQTKPVVASLDDSNLFNQYAPQREMTLLERVYRAGKLTGMLRENQRSIGTVAQWAAENFYNGQMRLVHEDNATPHIAGWLRAIFGTRVLTNTILLAVTNASAVQIGTSWSHPTHVAQVADLLWYVHIAFPRKVKVLNVSPYSQQKHALAGEVKRHERNN
jgi:hypothetical protein